MPTDALGRLEQFDERSRDFPVRALVAAEKKPRSYTWACEPRLDQGRDGSCVGFAWAHEIAARPVCGFASDEMGRLIYREATRIDPWTENDAGPDMSFGTSVLAGVKVAMSLGHYTGYRWAFGLEDLIMAIGYVGPVVLGIPWTTDMFKPNAEGVIRLGGGDAGGHAILANGVDLRRKMFRLHNSWGPRWGLNGECFISFEDMDTLLHQGGEACIAVRRV